MLGFFSQGTAASLYDGHDWLFQPRWLSVDNAHPWICARRAVTKYKSFADFCDREQPASVCFHRAYALGDILMLLPVIRAMQRQYDLPSPVRLAVNERFMPALRGLPATSGIQLVRSRGVQRDYGCAVHVALDRVLEADHWGGQESELHRVELYTKALGVTGG